MSKNEITKFKNKEYFDIDLSEGMVKGNQKASRSGTTDANLFTKK